MLKGTLVVIGVVVLELLQFFPFWRFLTFETLIIYKPADKFWPSGLISIKPSQMMSYTKFFNQKNIKQFWQFIHILQTRIKIYLLVCKLSLWPRRYLKLCKNISCHIELLWVKFGHYIVYSFWVIKIFLLLGSVLFWSVKCTSVLKKTLGMTKIYNTCF